MYPKAKIEAIVLRYSPLFIEALGLQDIKITVKVFHSKSKKYKRTRAANHSKGTIYGLTYVRMKSKKATIFLFYNNAKSRKDAILTLFHEILHIRFSVMELPLHGVSLSHKVTRGLYDSEESMVRSIEKLMGEILFNNTEKYL